MVNDRELAEYHRCVSRIKLMVGGPMPKPLTLRESVRQNRFAEAMAEAMHCELFDFWPLAEQQQFVKHGADLSPEIRTIRAHEQASELHRRFRFHNAQNPKSGLGVP